MGTAPFPSRMLRSIRHKFCSPSPQKPAAHPLRKTASVQLDDDVSRKTAAPEFPEKRFKCQAARTRRCTVVLLCIIAQMDMRDFSAHRIQHFLQLHSGTPLLLYI